MTNAEERNETLKNLHFNPDEQRIIKELKQKVDITVPYGIRDNPFLVVAGGCFTSWLWDEKPKDIDVFVLGDPTHPAIQEQIHRNTRSYIKANFPDVKDNTDEYRRENENVLEVHNAGTYQFIFTKHPNREALVKDFDFKHCMVSLWRHQLFITRSTYKAIMNKELIINNDKRIAQWREAKFMARGWTKTYTTSQYITGAATKPHTVTGVAAYQKSYLEIDWEDL